MIDRGPWHDRLLVRSLLVAGLFVVLSAPATAQEPVAWLTQPVGAVEVRRAGTTGWARVDGAHVELYVGDEVRTRERARAILLLESTERVRLGAGSRYTVGETAEVSRGGVRALVASAWNRVIGRPTPQATGAARAPGDEAPVLERPRYGLVLTPRPTFRWLASPSHADGYQARLVRDTTDCLEGPDGGAAVWGLRAVADTTLHYPEEHDPLRPGESYVFAVSPEPDPDAVDWGCFTVATDEARRAMEDAWRELQAAYATEDAGEVTAELLYAALLLDGGYYADALGVLDVAEERQPDSAAAARLRAYVYEEAGPPLLVTPAP